MGGPSPSSKIPSLARALVSESSLRASTHYEHIIHIQEQYPYRNTFLLEVAIMVHVAPPTITHEFVEPFVPVLWCLLQFVQAFPKLARKTLLSLSFETFRMHHVDFPLQVTMKKAILTLFKVKILSHYNAEKYAYCCELYHRREALGRRREKGFYG